MARFSHHGTGFFEGFRAGRVFDGLAVFHKACGQGPVAFARLDGAPAQQHLGAPHGHATGDDIGVLIMNGLAVVAHIPQARIAQGDASWLTVWPHWLQNFMLGSLALVPILAGEGPGGKCGMAACDTVGLGARYDLVHDAR
jgi:hypothetical protein